MLRMTQLLGVYDRRRSPLRDQPISLPICINVEKLYKKIKKERTDGDIT